MPLNKIIDDDINRRKNEAIKRANEAHKKATEKREQEKVLAQEDSSKLDQPDSKNQKVPTKTIFEALMEDSERTMILVLILLLVDEGADMGIILALMYLII